MIFRNSLRMIGRWLLAGICLLLCGGAYACYQRTIVVWWWPVAAAGAIALLTLPPMRGRWSRITGTDDRTLNSLCHLFAAGSIAAFALLAGNYFLSDPATVHGEEALIEARIHRTRQHYRTMRHHRRVPTHKSEHYYLRLRLADGSLKEWEVPLARYNRTHEGGTLTLNLQRGFFGFPVIAREP